MTDIKKKKKPEDESFGFENDFEHMKKEMEKITERIIKQVAKNFNKTDEDKISRIQGFSIRIDSNGKINIKEFGERDREKPEKHVCFSDNSQEGFGQCRTKGALPLGLTEQEPFMEIIKQKKEIIVLVELPDVEKDEITVREKDEKLEINVNGIRKKYYKLFELPVKGNFEMMKTTYNNGVLEIVIPKYVNDE